MGVWFVTRCTHSRPRSFFTQLHFYPFEQLSNCYNCKPPKSCIGGDPEVVVSPSVGCRHLELVGHSLLRVFFHAFTQTRAGALRTSTRTSSRTTTRFQQRQTHVMSQFRTRVRHMLHIACTKPFSCAGKLCSLQSMQTLHGRMQCDRCTHLCRDNFTLAIE